MPKALVEKIRASVHPINKDKNLRAEIVKCKDGAAAADLHKEAEEKKQCKVCLAHLDAVGRAQVHQSFKVLDSWHDPESRGAKSHEQHRARHSMHHRTSVCDIVNDASQVMFVCECLRQDARATGRNSVCVVVVVHAVWGDVSSAETQKSRIGFG